MSRALFQWSYKHADVPEIPDKSTLNKKINGISTRKLAIYATPRMSDKRQ